MHYTEEDDDLGLPWNAGSVFANPPYGRNLAKWIAKAHGEASSGRAGLVIALVPARTDTRWWHQHVVEAADIWMLRGRVAFGDGSQPAPFASAIIIWSATDVHRTRMKDEFREAWHIRAGDGQAKGVLAAE